MSDFRGSLEATITTVLLIILALATVASVYVGYQCGKRAVYEDYCFSIKMSYSDTKKICYNMYDENQNKSIPWMKEK